MAKLPKSLIKKYGISKKAWSVFRSRQNKRSKPKRKSKISYSRKRTINKMAKRKRKTYRKTTSGLKPSQVLIGGGLYGAVRSYLDGFLKPVTSKVPLGTIADEAALFTLGYFVNKKMKDKTIKSVAMAAMAVEAARMGEAFRDGSAFGISSNGAGSTFATFG